MSARPADRRDGLALLPGEPDFLLHHAAFERGGRDDKHEVLELLRSQRVLDLAPPVLSALERDDVLPDRESLLFQHDAKVARESGAVPAGIGNEYPARMTVGHAMTY